MSSTPYIPNPDAQFQPWLDNFASVIGTSPTTYFLTAGDAAAIQTQADDFDAAYALATGGGTRGPATVAAKDAARTNALAVVRPYAVAIAGNPAISNDDKVAVGVTVRATTRTPTPPPTTAPILGLLNIIPNALNLKYADTATPSSKLKPAGAIGLQLFANFGTVPATDPSQCALALTATKTPFQLDTTGQAGKVVTMFARWVTRGGPSGLQQVGPWSSQLVAHAS
jgi:hypothetical protein